VNPNDLYPREDWIVAQLLTPEKAAEWLGHPRPLVLFPSAPHALNTPVRYALALRVGPGRRARPCETRVQDLLLFTDRYERLSPELVMVRERDIEAIAPAE